MSARSLNKATLIGNLTRDPELRYTPAGTAVCSFSLATNRSWTTDSGEKKEETEYHRIVAWNKLAELCSQLLSKGRKVYVEGRLQTRTWQAQDGTQRTSTEIVIEDMIVLDPRRVEGYIRETAPVTPASAPAIPVPTTVTPSVTPPTSISQADPETKQEKSQETINPDDIPF